MSTAIVYYSKHHGNTKKLLDAIAEKHPVTLIDVTAQPDADLSGYERIGFASGIYYSAFAKQIISFANAHLPERKDVFYIYTHGAPKGDCQGFDTFGPFKLVGGIAKGHPTEEEIKGAVTFYQQL